MRQPFILGQPLNPLEGGLARPHPLMLKWQSRWWITCWTCQRKAHCGEARERKTNRDLLHALVADVLGRHPCSRPRIPEGAEPCTDYLPLDPQGE